MSKVLTKAQKDLIIDRFNAGETNKTQLGREFGVSARTIGRVVEKAHKKLEKKAAKVVETSKFQVGDLVVGNNITNPYSITTDKAVMKVIEFNKIGYFKVEILSHSDGFYKDMVGQSYWVDPEHFDKIGSISQGVEVAEVQEVVEEPVKVVKPFEVGDRVELVNIFEAEGELRKYSVWGWDSSNVVGNSGKIVKVDTGSSGDWIKVEWDDGSNNLYKPHNLVHEVVEVPQQPTNVAHIITEMAVTLSVDGKMQLIDFSHPSFKEVKVLIAAGKFREASDMMDIKKAIETFSEGSLAIVKGVVNYRGVPLQNALANKIVSLMGQGDEGFKGFAKFMAKVMENPSLKTRERLMDFVAAEDIGISVEGDVVCYKNVKEDYKPSRAGVWKYSELHKEWLYVADEYYDNNIGNVLAMPRSEVDDVDSNTCSKGLHVMSLSYAKQCWGTRGHNLVVHVNPIDFVSIPTDYNNSKARVCKYTVVAELSKVELDTLMAKI